MNPTISQVARFLRTLEDSGLGFGAINAARCALSIILPQINGETVGKHEVIHWLLRSIYERNPPKPKYSRFWDVSLVFKMLQSWPHNRHLDIKKLGFKVAILLLLITGHKGQTIVALSLNGLDLDNKEATFDLSTLLKSNRLGDPLSSIHVSAFKDDRKLCIVSAIKEYLFKTKELRNSRQLLVSFIKPHKGISRDTLARWTITVLKEAGIDTDRYASHSTRGAMASKAKLLGISVKRILAHAGWKTARSFARHYNKRLEKGDGVARRLLQK